MDNTRIWMKNLINEIVNVKAEYKDVDPENQPITENGCFNDDCDTYMKEIQKSIDILELIEVKSGVKLALCGDKNFDMLTVHEDFHTLESFILTNLDVSKIKITVYTAVERIHRYLLVAVTEIQDELICKWLNKIAALKDELSSIIEKSLDEPEDTDLLLSDKYYKNTIEDSNTSVISEDILNTLVTFVTAANKSSYKRDTLVIRFNDIKIKPDQAEDIIEFNKIHFNLADIIQKNLNEKIAETYLMELNDYIVGIENDILQGEFIHSKYIKALCVICNCLPTVAKTKLYEVDLRYITTTKKDLVERLKKAETPMVKNITNHKGEMILTK